MALTDKLSSIASAIREKTGESDTMTLDQMPENIRAISGKEDIEWHQCPELVKSYLNNVTYDTDYTYTHITEYAPSTVVVSNTKPIGKEVDGTTFYNNIPNKMTPFALTNKAGTLKPLDSLRWINSVTSNMRDLGGWQCDGGTVKYGKIYRSGAIDASDTNLFVNELGIQTEIDLRDEEQHSAVLGDSVEYVDIAGSSIWYTINAGLDAWKAILRTSFDCAVHNKPLVFHCSAGRDRTGTVACILEAILGVSQSDIDKDYELTCFASYDGTNGDPKRTKISWSGNGGLIPMINAKTGNTFRDKVINWVASIGFTAAEINAFRAAMIDGYNPQTDDVTPIIIDYSVVQNLAGIVSNNTAESIAKGKEYIAEFTADSEHNYGVFSISMSGSDVKESVYEELAYPEKKGRVHIPAVSGDLIITATGTSKNPYQLCEYIATVGYNSGAYVDTQYVNTEHTGIECTLQFPSVSSTYYSNSWMGNDDFCFGSNGKSDARAYKGGVESYQLSSSLTAGTEYVVSLNKNDDGKVSFNGVEKSWKQGTPSFAKDKSIYIFKGNGSSVYPNNAYMKCYGAAIYENGTKVRDLKPCYRVSDGVCGMYDILNDMFYPATGSFEHGREIDN